MHVMAVVGGHELHSCACKPRERFVASFACATCRHAADQGRDAHVQPLQLPAEPGILSKDEVAAQAATWTLASMIVMASQSKKSSWRIQYRNSRLRAPLRVHNTARGTNSIWFARW